MFEAVLSHVEKTYPRSGRRRSRTQRAAVGKLLALGLGISSVTGVGAVAAGITYATGAAIGVSFS